MTHSDTLAAPKTPDRPQQLPQSVSELQQHTISNPRKNPRKTPADPRKIANKTPANPRSLRGFQNTNPRSHHRSSNPLKLDLAGVAGVSQVVSPGDATRHTPNKTSDDPTHRTHSDHRTSPNGQRRHAWRLVAKRRSGTRSLPKESAR